MPNPRLDSSELATDTWYGDERQSEVPVSELAPGETLGNGRFRVLGTRGRGAMGRVYAVVDHERGQTVALKTLRLASPEAAHALKLEFRALRDLAHPNLVRLHELFVDGEEVFFTMDLVEGVRFDKADRTLLRALLVQLVAALETLHAAGKLHRDIKPANVLVEPSGRLVVLDFGLVHDRARAPDDSRRTGSGLVGTPRYMSPELLAGHAASEGSDWYAVGVMLYEVLTGELPDEGGLARLLRQSRPDPPSSRRQGIDRQLDSLCAALLDPNEELRARGADVLRALGVAPEQAPRSVPPPRATTLVGRDAQLERLAVRLRRFRSDRTPVAVMVRGRSGMGKSALVAEFLSHHTADTRVYSAQCREQEAVSHKAFDEIADALVSDLQQEYEGRAFELISPTEAQDLIRLFPGLRRIPELWGMGEEDASADPRTLRKRAYDALRSALSRLSHDRPLILAIDDLQWGDEDSARLLVELFSGAGSPACFVLLSFREDEVGSSRCLERLLRGSRCLADVMDVEQVDVARLSEVDASRLASSLLDVPESDPRVRALCKEAGGSPLLLHELSLEQRMAQPSGNQVLALGDIVRARLERVGALPRRVFELLCVSAVPTRQLLLRRAAGNAEVSRAIVDLETVRLVHSRTSRGADAVEVIHDAIRSAALAALTPELVRTLHEDLARAHSVEPSPDVEALCRHYAGARLQAESAHWAQKAAARAKASFAFAHAAFLYRRALELIEDDNPIGPFLRVELAHALADAGHGAEAAQLFTRAAEDTASPQDALEYRRRAAEQWLFTGHIQRGLDVLQEVYTSLGMSLPQGNVKALLALTVDRIKLGARGTEFVERAVAEIAPLELLRLDACRAGWMLNYVSPLVGAVLQSRYLRLAIAAGEPSRVSMGLGIEALQHSIEGDNPGRFMLQERARELAERIGSPHALGFQAAVDSNCAYLAGEWEECSRHAERAEHLLTRKCRGSTWELNTVRFFWALSLYYQGRFRELRRRSEIWISDAEERGDLCALAGLHLNGARSFCLVDDDPERAREAIALGLREWSFPELGVHRFLAELARVQVQLYEGDAEGALATVRQLGGEFRVSTLRRVQLCRILYHYHQGYVAVALAASGDAKKLKARLRRARRHQAKLEGEGTSWGNAYARYISAQCHLLGKKPEEGIEQLRLAAEGFDQAEMYALAAATRHRLAQRTSGSEGAALLDASRSFFQSQGVAAPERLACALAPGA